jgi:hypothetical protein
MYESEVAYCAYGHSVATLLNPRGVTTVSHKYCLTVTRHATVVVAVPSTVNYLANYKIKIYSIHPMALQPKSGLGLLYWGSVTIMFYGVRLLASRPTPVNFGGPMIFCWGLLP